MRFLNSFGVLYPVFGYDPKYLIYKLTVKFYDAVVFEETPIVERHRGFLHSVLGLGTATVLTSVYLLPKLYAIELFSAVFSGVFLFSYFAGATLHLVEDSCTKSGFQWHYPFRHWTVRRNLKTTLKLQDTIYQWGFLVVPGGGVTILFFLSSLVVRSVRSNSAFSSPIRGELIARPPELAESGSSAIIDGRAVVMRGRNWLGLRGSTERNGSPTTRMTWTLCPWSVS